MRRYEYQGVDPREVRRQLKRIESLARRRGRKLSDIRYRAFGDTITPAILEEMRGVNAANFEEYANQGVPSYAEEAFNFLSNLIDELPDVYYTRHGRQVLNRAKISLTDWLDSWVERVGWVGVATAFYRRQRPILAVIERIRYEYYEEVIQSGIQSLNQLLAGGLSKREYKYFSSLVNDL